MENKEGFTQLYTRLYNENFNELEALREKEKSKTIKIILGLIGVFVAFPIFPPLGIVLFIVFVVFVIKNNIKTMKKRANAPKVQIKNGVYVSAEVLQGEKSYKNVFKEKIITPIINHVFPEAKYTPFLGIRESDYMMAHWEDYDSYNSEDRIITPVNLKENKEINLELTIAEVHTENRHEDDEGHVSYTTVFHGLAGSINLPKNIGCYLKVVKNGLNLFGGPKDGLQMDMAEFEKMFDVKTDDRIKAMQILTSDIMTELIDLVRRTKVKFEFYINKDIMDIISAVKNVIQHICDVIYSTEL